MLVLSRKENQKIRFPSLGITVQILRVGGSAVRVGVDAPAEVRIIRDELEDEGPADSTQRGQTQIIRLPRALRHELRNELNSLSIALHLFKQEVDAGFAEDAAATFDKLVAQLERISENQVLSREGVTQPLVHESTALVVDDEPNEREMLAGFLRLHGFQVSTAPDGQAAIESLETGAKPSVLLIDMRMPRCDGATTIRRIRENQAFDGMKIFAISGSTPEENRLNIKRDGVTGWFMKPLNPKSLVEAMATAVCHPEPTAA
jgi:carbon storage regulator CsrA